MKIAGRHTHTSFAQKWELFISDRPREYSCDGKENLPLSFFFFLAAKTAAERRRMEKRMGELVIPLLLLLP